MQCSRSWEATIKCQDVFWCADVLGHLWLRKQSRSSISCGWDWWFYPQLPLVMWRSVLEQDTEPLISPHDQVSALHSSPDAMVSSVCQSELLVLVKLCNLVTLVTLENVYKPLTQACNNAALHCEWQGCWWRNCYFLLLRDGFLPGETINKLSLFDFVGLTPKPDIYDNVWCFFTACGSLILLKCFGRFFL